MDDRPSEECFCGHRSDPGEGGQPSDDIAEHSLISDWCKHVDPVILAAADKRAIVLANGLDKVGIHASISYPAIGAMEASSEMTV